MESGWLVGARRPGRPVLVCLPHAGGSASTYAGWAARLPDVDVLAVELPGHGRRRDEVPVGSMDAVVNSLTSELSPLTASECVLFGHSMGALVAFALSSALSRHGKRSPRLVVVSGALPPGRSIPRQRGLHRAGAEALWAEIRRLGGTPDLLSEDPGMRELLTPTLRADFALAESFTRPADRVLACPVVALAGQDDEDVPPGALDAWAEVTTGPFMSRRLPGGHFYREDGTDQLIRLLDMMLLRFRGKGSG